MTMERMQILVTAEQRAWLEQESATRGQACTAIIRDAIDAARGVRPLHARLAAFERVAAKSPAAAIDAARIEAALRSRYRGVPE